MVSGTWHRNPENCTIFSFPKWGGRKNELNTCRTCQAMIKNLLEFLWEYAINHSMYIRNRSYTKNLENQTPYEIRFQRKPNVSHLCEFGVPIWVLLQGQKKPRKMEPKSKRHIFAGFDDGSKSIKYFNAETCKVLTSCNFRFLFLPSENSPLEEIIITSNASCEEEESGSMQSKGSNNLKRKRTNEGNKESNERRCTRGIKIDYWYLNNPFPDEKENANEAKTNEVILTSIEEIYNSITGDELKSLKEAQSLPDWPEWEKAIKAELTQLQQMGTWRLVDKPSKAIPIANKWVFLKKRNRLGDIIKYKA
jgi:hypothetical protein